MSIAFLQNWVVEFVGKEVYELGNVTGFMVAF
jgi:hypothetical protein